MSSSQPPPEIQVVVLRRSRRRCALCFAYDFDRGTKQGQIAHIDHNSDNNDPENLIFLCLKHHEDYDTRTSQSKGIMAEEVTRSRLDLDTFIQQLLPTLSPEAESITDNDFESSSEDEPTISVETYRARIPVYNAYRTLLSKVMREARVEMADLFTFANDTHEALFLYGEEVANYLNDVYRHGVGLWASQREMEHPERHSEDAWRTIVEKNLDLILWFSNGFSEARMKFLKYLRIK